MVCQSGYAADWIDKQKNNLLPFTYFLATFTMPQELRNLCRKRQRLFYSILFKASADALKILAKDEKYLGAEMGMIAILHSWTRALIYHAHVHYLIPGGGIGNDGKTIRFSDDDFLMHVKPLSIIFKAKFRDCLKKKAPDLFMMIPANTWKRNWVVHIKPVGNGDRALEYMGRYLFRVAISNNRILKFKDGMVTFRYTDSNTGKTKIVTLDALEFIRRFLQHVLPYKFMKVRYYGFLAPASKKKLNKIKKMLFMDSIHVNNTGNGHKADKIIVCPDCGNPLQWIKKLPKGLKDNAP